MDEATWRAVRLDDLDTATPFVVPVPPAEVAAWSAVTADAAQLSNEEAGRVGYLVRRDGDMIEDGSHLAPFQDE